MWAQIYAVTFRTRPSRPPLTPWRFLAEFHLLPPFPFIPLEHWTFEHLNIWTFEHWNIWTCWYLQHSTFYMRSHFYLRSHFSLSCHIHSLVAGCVEGTSICSVLKVWTQIYAVTFLSVWHLASGSGIWHMIYDIWYITFWTCSHILTCSHVHMFTFLSHLKMWTQIYAVTFSSQGGRA